jgi:hypothetical protein
MPHPLLPVSPLLIREATAHTECSHNKPFNHLHQQRLTPLLVLSWYSLVAASAAGEVSFCV